MMIEIDWKQAKARRKGVGDERGDRQGFLKRGKVMNISFINWEHVQ